MVKPITLAALLLLLSLNSSAQESVLDSQLRLTGNSIRASRALSEVSRLTGFLFTYDTRIINGERIFAIPGHDMKVREILDSVTGDPVVSYSVIGRHIILYREAEAGPGRHCEQEALL